jgi:hypothetical protein
MFERLWLDTGAYVARLSARLGELGPARPRWSAAVRQQIEQSVRRLESQDIWLSDLHDRFAPDMAERMFRDLLRRFGLLLAAWPRLLECTAKTAPR